MSKAANLLRMGIGLAAMIAATATFAADPQPWQLNMGPGVSEISREVYWLHNFILIICTIIGLLVFSAMGYALFRFRRSKNPVPSTFSHNVNAEVVWTIIPVIILIIVAWPSTTTLFKMYDTSESDLTVKITGYQWMWKYEIVNYRGEPTGVSFISRLDDDSVRARHRNSGIDPRSVRDGDFQSYLLNVDKPLVLPINTKVRFVLTADDVIHSWWVPALGWKQDAVPGMVNEQWTNISKAGTYRGQCAELCGKDHGFMPIVVKAVEPAEFENWLAEQPNSTYLPTERIVQAEPTVPNQG